MSQAAGHFVLGDGRISTTTNRLILPKGGDMSAFPIENHRMKYSIIAAVVLTSLVCTTAAAELQVGAAAVDVSPKQFPVLINGGMLSRTASGITAPVKARAVVLDDGQTRIGIVVVDSCMMPRELIDAAKKLAANRTQIKPDRMLISATHTHSAPSSLSCLGTEADTTYTPLLRAGIAEALVKAEANLEPAFVGWAVSNCAEFTALRRWIRRPDRMDLDPFGNRTVRANMHAGSNWDNVVGESGPEDPDLSMIAFRSKSGRPIAVLANFSMHYYSGQAPVGADYFGLFCDGFAERVMPTIKEQSKNESAPPFVGLLSHGCSGDIWRRDYTLPKDKYDPYPKMEEYTQALLDRAFGTYESIQYASGADLAMAETRMELKYRVADEQRLEWARTIVDAMGDRPPKDRTEVYAREQLILAERQSTEIVVQAVRIGDIAIATTPNETYALTGLKLKLQSPLPKTMVIELANGGDGYIPPPEQHLLGGYNTWAARSAGLEVQAEPKIAEAGLQLLEAVADKPRRIFRQGLGPASQRLAKLKPVAWWRLDEMAGVWAKDSSGNGEDAVYDPAVAFFLEGPASDKICTPGETNRCVHFAGGRLRARLPQLKQQYTVSMWFWNGMPNDARETTGWLFSHDHNLDLGQHGIHLGLGGTATKPGRLIVQHGDGSGESRPVVGSTEIKRWAWNHVALVREDGRIRVFLNGNARPEIDMQLADQQSLLSPEYFFAGRSDNHSNWEGRLDEITVFDRSLADEITRLSNK
jgi:hypothetical protein